MSKIILSTSDEAAKLVTVSLWQSSKGNLFNNEDAARYDGCTHRPCQECGEPAEKMYTHCESCRDKRDTERYAKREKIAWDYETPIYSETFDKFLMNANDLESILDEFDKPLIDCVASVLKLVSCEPIYMSQVPENYWCDDLAEDQELSDDINNALCVLNNIISKHPPISWCPGKYAITL